MANVIKHKRGSGSDPVANDLVVGEVAIRTDTGKLFTKMDNGSVAEIAGGGSDIAINTLSSSSGAGGGSATFNGSAYRFTLSQPPSVSAYQLLVSINGVIQKPVSGTGQPSEGFAVDGTDIILGDAPETGADFFILTFKSLGVSEPADNSVTSAKILDGTILNVDINASAAIAGTKISPDFGSQNIVTTGNAGIGATPSTGYQLQVTGQSGYDDVVRITGVGTNIGPRINLTPTGTGVGRLNATANSLQLQTVGNTALTIDTSQRVGIGTTSPTNVLTLIGTGNDAGIDLTSTGAHALRFKIDSNQTSANDTIFFQSARWNGTEVASIHMRAGADTTNKDDGSLTFHTATSGSSNAERMRIASNGDIGIGTTTLNRRDAGRPLVQFDYSGSDASEGLEVRLSNSAINGNASTDNLQITYIGQDFNINNTENGNIVFYNNGSERFRINSSGNVGIGTSSPEDSLHIKGGKLRIENTIVSNNDSTISYDNADFIIDVDPNNVRGSSLFQVKVDTVAGLTIDDNRRLLIGTTASATVGGGAASLHQIETTSQNAISCVAHRGTGNASGSILILGKSRGTSAGAVTSVGINDELGSLRFAGADDTDLQSRGGEISCEVDGTPGSNDMPGRLLFKTTADGSAAPTERMRIDSSGNLGIGTTSPDRTIHCHNSSNTTNVRAKFSNGTTGEGASDGFEIGINASDPAQAVLVNYEASPMAFFTNASERMRIDSSGNVGIGTTSPSDRLEIQNTTSDKGILLKSTGNNFHTICGDANRSQATDNILRLDAKWNGSVVSRIRMLAGNDTTNKDDGIICFDTDSGSGMSERMRIDSSGQVLIGTTSSGGPGGLTISPFHDDGACTLIFDRANTSDTSTVLAFENNNSGVGSITHGNSSTSFNTSSDYRLKENVTAISDGITRLKTLKPYRFNFKVDDSKTVDGFFAHEVTAVPEAITGTKDETQDILYTEDDTIPSGKKIGDVKEVQPVYQGIDQSKLVPLLTAALQEAVGKIEVLETKVAALEAK